MKIKITKELFLFGLITVVLIIATVYITHTEHFLYIKEAAQQRPFYFFLFMAAMRFIGLIYPPFSGGIFTVAGIPIVGWELSFAADFLGSILGGVINYFLAKKYGKRIIKMFLGEDAVEKLNTIKFKKDKEFESILVGRILFGAVILELIHYAAGIFRVSFTKYLLAIVCADILLKMPVFYLIGNILGSNNIWITVGSVLLLLAALPLLYKLRNRYIE